MSKLQTDIATSTMESEYNAFSMSMREVLPLQNLTTTIVKALGLHGIGLTEFKATKRKDDKFLKTTMHEDIDGAMKLAKMEPGRMTPRSKHYCVKYHWFRTELKPNKIEIQRVDTKLQKADFLTKALMLLYWSNPVSQVLRAMAFKRTTSGRSNFGELMTVKIS
jgi:hypothetical protein